MEISFILHNPFQDGFSFGINYNNLETEEGQDAGWRVNLGFFFFSIEFMDLSNLD